MKILKMKKGFMPVNQQAETILLAMHSLPIVRMGLMPYAALGHFMDLGIVLDAIDELLAGLISRNVAKKHACNPTHSAVKRPHKNVGTKGIRKPNKPLKQKFYRGESVVNGNTKPTKPVKRRQPIYKKYDKQLIAQAMKLLQEGKQPSEVSKIVGIPKINLYYH